MLSMRCWNISMDAKQVYRSEAYNIIKVNKYKLQELFRLLLCYHSFYKCRHYSSTENKPKRQENVDMFAAPSKNLNVKIAPPNNNNITTVPITSTVTQESPKVTTSASTSTTPPLPNTPPSTSASTSTSSSSARTSEPSSSSSSSSSNSGSSKGDVSLRAEKLRLEAERAQLEVDQSRIDQEKVPTWLLMAIR